MTHLRKMMLEELQRRNLSKLTAECYLRVVEEFALFYKRPPDQLGPEQIRQYQAHLFTDRKTGRQHGRTTPFGSTLLLQRAVSKASCPTTAAHPGALICRGASDTVLGVWGSVAKPCP